MALTNAERQKRHRERLKSRNGYRDALDAMRLEWLDEGIRQATEDGDEGDLAALTALRNDPPDFDDIDIAVHYAIDHHMSRRLRAAQRAMAKGRPRTRSRPKPSVHESVHLQQDKRPV